jgi:hypothetical protein
MERKKKWIIALRVLLIAILLLAAGVGSFSLWVTTNYKRILMQHLPDMVASSSDSLYHISFSDITVSLVKHQVTATNVRLWADTNQANRLRKMNRYSPNTVSFVTAPKIEAFGVGWENILSNKLLNCQKIIVYNPQWFMQTVKHHPDLSQVEEKEKSSMMHRFTVQQFEVVKPHLTYHYIGDNNTYYLFLKGGTAVTHDWAIDRDLTKDTSVILYSKYGSVRPDSIIFKKDGHIYSVKSPVIDFTTSENSVTLKDVRIKNFIDIDTRTGHLMETYNFKFPAIELTHFNWKKLLHKDVLDVASMHVTDPFISVHYVRENVEAKDRMGSFPNQLIHEAIKTNIRTLHVKNGRIKYAEPVNNSDTDFVLQFDNLNGEFKNITNIDSEIARNKTCRVTLEARYMNKSPIAATFDLSLSDPRGHFVVNGYINNLDGDDVSKQASAYTFAKVTSFKLTHMDGHIEGDESYAQGSYVMLYHDLKISLFKFKSDKRKSSKGPFSFLADALILYPDNPMPGKEPRKTSTHLARDPNHGFIYLLWQSMYLGAQKTAVRDEGMIKLAGGKTDDDSGKKDDKPKKKGFFRRLFGKLKK